MLATACDPWSRAEANRAAAEAAWHEAKVREAEVLAEEDAKFAALTPAQHVESARTIVNGNGADDPLSTPESRRAELDRAERHLRAIPPGAAESAAAAELAAMLATERGKLGAAPSSP